MERLRYSIENMLIETDQGIVIPITISAGLALLRQVLLVIKKY